MNVDHVAILSDDLAAAMERYTRMGFAVQRGGRHPGAGSENALVGLADGSYLELIALLDPQHAATHRFWQMADGRVKPAGAYGGYALGTPDLAATLAGIEARGLPMVGPRAGARDRPDGRRVAWQTAMASRPDLPFLIQDETPRSLRVPDPGSGLGAGLRIVELRVVVESLAEAAPVFGRLLDQPTGGTDAEVRLDWGVIRLTERRAGTARRAFEAAGPGLFAIVLGPTGAGAAALGPLLRRDAEGETVLDPALTEGAVIAVRGV
jgi:hypothetical protein